MPADIRSILDPLKVDNSLKADAWDGFHAASSPEDFQSRFDKLKLPTEVKAALWDAKFGTGEAPETPPSAPKPELKLNWGEKSMGIAPPGRQGKQPELLPQPQEAPAPPKPKFSGPIDLQTGNPLPSAFEAEYVTAEFAKQAVNKIARIGSAFMHAGNRSVAGFVANAGGALEALGADGLGKEVRTVGEGLTTPVPEFMKDKAGASFLDRPELLLDPEYIADLMGNAVGSIAAMGATGGGGLIGGSITETVTDAGNAYTEALNKTRDRGQAVDAFRKTILTELPTTLAFNKLGLFGDKLKGAAKTIASGVSEGAQEVAQGVAQRWSMNSATGSQESLWKGADVEALSGLLGGTVVGGALEKLSPEGVQPQPQPTTQSSQEQASDSTPATPALSPQAVQSFLEEEAAAGRKPNTSDIQRKFRVGYGEVVGALNEITGKAEAPEAPVSAPAEEDQRKSASPDEAAAEVPVSAPSTPTAPPPPAERALGEYDGSMGELESDNAAAPAPPSSAEPTDNFEERMRGAKDADEGRTIIGEHAELLNRLDREIGLKPSVGQIEKNYSRGFSTLTSKEKKAWVKKAKAADPVIGARIEDLIRQGDAFRPVFEDLYKKSYDKFHEGMAGAPVKPADLKNYKRDGTPKPKKNVLQQRRDEKRAKAEATTKESPAPVPIPFDEDEQEPTVTYKADDGSKREGIIRGSRTTKGGKSFIDVEDVETGELFSIGGDRIKNPARPTPKTAEVVEGDEHASIPERTLDYSDSQVEPEPAPVVEKQPDPKVVEAVEKVNKLKEARDRKRNQKEETPSEPKTPSTEQGIPAAAAEPERGVDEASQQSAHEANAEVEHGSGHAEANDTKTEYPKAGETVDGLVVRSSVPNQDSIGASLYEYEELSGIREVPMADVNATGPYKATEYFYSASDIERTDRLAGQIEASGEINPLIIVVAKEGPYILEGGHRIAALHKLGKNSFPAMVVRDLDSLEEAESEATEQTEAEQENVKSPREQMIARVRQAIDNKEDIRLTLERIAEKVMGGTRAAGTFSKQDIYEMQEAAVNSWLIENGKRLLAMDFNEAVAELRGMMGRLATQTVRSSEKIAKQQFSTPPSLAYLVDRLAAARPTDVVLEPSGGIGGLVSMLKPVVAEVHINEIDSERAELARQIGFENITGHDGEIINAEMDPNFKPTLIVMNPPFTAGVVKSYEAKKDSKYGFNHVEQALQRLAPGGRAVIILGDLNAKQFGDRGQSQKERAFWKKIGEQYNIRANVGTSGKEYAKYGTTFDNRIVIVDKTGPTTGEIVGGRFETIEEAWNAVESIANSRPDQSSRKEESGTRVAGPAIDGVVSDSELPGRSGKAAKTARSGSRRSGTLNGRASGTTGSGTPEASPDVPGSQLAGTTEATPEAPAQSNVALPVGRVADLQIEQADRSGGQDDDAGAYVKYKPTVKGAPHKGDIVETKTMATVPLPTLTYKPSIDPDVIESGKLSAIQLEAVVIAGMQNDIVLPDGSRAAALIGDGTGVGKGRIAAGIILDNWNKGRKKLIWVSEKWTLAEDAQRDLRGIGADHLAKTLKRGDKVKHGTSIDHEGVLFVTYSWLRGENKTGSRRVAQLMEYVGEQGDGAVIVFDESHNLKNTVTGGSKVSKTGSRTKELLDKRPSLRPTFLSATAMSEVENMGYLGRLGLWGPRTAFPGGFGDFSAAMGSSGISGMELVAREMKAQGKYIGRNLSYRGVEYSERSHPLNADQKKVYRDAAEAWDNVEQWITRAVGTVNGDHSVRSRFMNQFWGAHQRFFNLLITALKIPTAISEVESALAKDRSVIITLVNTNEAIQKRQEERVRDQGEDEEEDDGLDFGPADILVSLVQQHFPTQQYRDDVDADGKPIKVPVFRIVDGKEVPVINPEAVKLRDELVTHLRETLRVPENPLDILINTFGAEQVAELTGRSKRYNPTTGKFEPRGNENSTNRKDVNLMEMRAFQDGDKRIALLSNAAGTGISLQSDLGAKNQQRRHHITLQFGWSADKQMQMFGRSHRTNQRVPPEYVMLVTDLAGEKRFVSTIAKRLGSLGALTRGSRDASGGPSSMSELNFDSVQGRAAARAFYNRMLSDIEIPGTDVSGMELLRRMGVLKAKAGVPEVDQPENVDRMLNRLLALDPDLQNPVFDYYADILDATVEQAIADGTLDTGVKELKGEKITVTDRQKLATDELTKAETFHYSVDVESKRNLVSPENLQELIKTYPKGSFYRHDKTGKLAFLVPARPITHADGSFEEAFHARDAAHSDPRKVGVRSLGPWTELSEYYRELKDKAQREVADATGNLAYFTKLSGPRDSWAANGIERETKKLHEAQVKLDEASKAASDLNAVALEQWTEQHSEEPETVTETEHLIGGAVLRYWGVLRQAMRDISLAQDSKTGERVVGVRLLPNMVQQVIGRIGGGGSTVTPDQVLRDVMQNGTEYQLEGGLRIRRGSVARNPVIQFMVSGGNGPALERLGVVMERGIVPVYYIPDNKQRFEVLQRVLERFPVENAPASSSSSGLYMGSGLGALQPYLEKLETAVKEAATGETAKAARDFFRPTGSRIADHGEAGKKTRDLLMRARDEGETAAGPRVAQLVYDTDIQKLSKQERLDLADILQGKAKASAKLAPVAKKVRAILDELGAEAVRLGVKVHRVMRVKANEDLPEGVKLNGLQKQWREQGRTITVRARVPFQPRKNYFPHRIPHPEQMKKGQIREDILTNMLRRKVRPTREDAATFLDNYIEYVESGKRAEKLMDWLVKTKQAQNHGEALEMLEKMRQNVIRRQPSLEFSRSVDLPFWDPDALRVMPGFITAQSKRLAQIEQFGQDHKKLTRLRTKIRKNEGEEAARFVEKATQEILGVADHDLQMEKLSAKLRSLQGWKLGLAFIPNMTQGFVNTWFNGDLRAAVTGVKAAFTTEGKRFGTESGAALDSVLNEALRNAGEDGRWLGQFLRVFTATERANRVIAANGGADFVRRTFEQLRSEPGSAKHRSTLQSLGIDPDAALQRGSLSGRDVLMGAKKFSDTSQFRGDVLDNPLFSASPIGKLFWQFKQFGYGQARMVVNRLVTDWKLDRPRLVRDLLVLGAVFPMAGAVIQAVRNLLKGGDDEKDKSILIRYFQAFIGVGALGVMSDLFQAGAIGKTADTILGPTLGSAAAGVNAAMSAHPVTALGKWFTRQLPMGSVIAPRLFPQQKKEGARRRIGGTIGSRRLAS